jgi:hypothetical protein
MTIDPIGSVASGGSGASPFVVDAMGYLFTMQSDRVASLVGGLEMWHDNPLFGAGLGAFMQHQIETTGIPLVIHNSLIWLGAEFGLAGLLAVLTVPAAVMLALSRDKVWQTEWTWAAAFGCLLVIGVFSLAHDMVYQRAFWLLLGAAIAAPRCMPVKTERSLRVGCSPALDLRAKNSTGAFF